MTKCLETTVCLLEAISANLTYATAIMATEAFGTEEITFDGSTMVVLFHRGWVTTCSQSIFVTFPAFFKVLVRNFKYMYVLNTWTRTFMCCPILLKL